MASVLSVLFDKVLKQVKSTDTRGWKGGGGPQGILGGGVPPRSPNPDPISDQKM